jgi:hypothetical protein
MFLPTNGLAHMKVTEKNRRLHRLFSLIISICLKLRLARADDKSFVLHVSADMVGSLCWD